uniref:Uncharacterized protein n=1 Tax=Arundo donax TaxID=35708 RepID=A0A0A9HN51_ARUDO
MPCGSAACTSTVASVNKTNVRDGTKLRLRDMLRVRKRLESLCV